MKVFIDIGHPAHVHYFKNLIKRLQHHGHSVVVTSREKEMAHELLNESGIPFFNRGKGGEGIAGKALYIIKADAQLFKIAKKEKPDLFLSFASPYCAHVSSLMGKHHIVIDDTENATFGHMLYRPFSDCILTPDCFKKEFGKKQIRFPSYMELSYLHPNVFQPNDSIFDLLGIEKDATYVIVRFVGWNAAHDHGHKGLSLANKIKAVKTFVRYANVFISSEIKLSDEFKPYELNIPKHRIHDALAYASMFYGESATMASESAVLGVPAIYIDDQGRGYTDEQEVKYGLVFNYSESPEDQIKSIEMGEELLMQNGKIQWNHKRNKILKEKIDLTQFLEKFIINYPESRYNPIDYF